MSDGTLSMEEVKSRIDELQAVVKRNEGDPDAYGDAWDELKHLQQVYDQMIRDSQGHGIQMLQDIMDKAPETQANYITGVPIASTQDQPEQGKELDGKDIETETETEGDGEEHEEPEAPAQAQPTINLTVNILKDGEDVNMERSFDSEVAALAKSDGFSGDVRIPLNMQAEMRKSQSAKSSIDGIDQDKIRAAKKVVEGEGGEEGEEEDEDLRGPGGHIPNKTGPHGRGMGPGKGKADGSGTGKKSNSIGGEASNMTKMSKAMDESFYRIETSTLQKSQMSRRTTILERLGRWANQKMLAKAPFDFIAKSMKTTLEKSAGASIVAGQKPVAGTSKAAYARIIALNAEIQTLEEQIQESPADCDKLVSAHRRLRDVYEELAFVTMQSEGLGLKTEDLIPPCKSPLVVDTQPGTSVKKSQSLEKSHGYKTGKVGNLKYALSYWKDAEGGLSKFAATKVKLPSADKAVSFRLKTKIPPLPKWQEHVIALGGDADAPIKGGSKSKGAKKVKHNHGKHLGQLKHIVKKK